MLRSRRWFSGSVMLPPVVSATRVPEGLAGLLVFAGRNSDKWRLHCTRARWWGVAWPPIMKWLSLQLWRAGGSLVLFGVA